LFEYPALLAIKMPTRADDFSVAIQRLAERRIEEAMRTGAFDNLPGKGKPIDIEPMPIEENARMLWWAMRTLRRPEPSPEELRLRGQIDDLKAGLTAPRTEQRIRALVRAINTLVRQLDAVPGGPRLRIAPVLLDQELARLGLAAAPAHSACANVDCRDALPPSARFCPHCGTRRPQKT
jgi:hypothetical protein